MHFMNKHSICIKYVDMFNFSLVTFALCYRYYYWCVSSSHLVVSTMWHLMITTILTLHVIIVITYNTTCSMPPNTSPLTLNYSSYQDYITFTLISSYKMFITFHSLVVQQMVQHQTQSSGVTHQLVLQLILLTWQ